MLPLIVITFGHIQIGGTLERNLSYVGETYEEDISYIGSAYYCV